MKVCLTTRYFDLTNAGIGRVGSETLRGLLNSGHQVVPISTNSTSLPNYLFYSQFQLPLMMPRNADVYHSITPVEGLWFPRTKPSVVSILDLIPILHPDRCGAGIGYNKLLNKIGTGYFGYCVSQCTRGATMITTLADETKEQLCRLYRCDPARVVVTRLGIRSDLAPMEKKPYRKNQNGGTVYGYIGQLDRRKRVDMLILAFRRYAEPKATLLIAGTGRDRQKLVELAGDDTRIRFLGFIDDNKLVEFYNSLDLFIFPSGAEGYGLPPVEAMACGIHTVVMADSYIPADVKDRCCLAENTSQMFKGFAMPNYTVGENMKWAQSHTWDNYNKTIMKVYEEAINNHG